MARVLNTTWGPVNFAGGASVYDYPVTVAGTYRIQVYLDAVDGGATDYVAWLQKQRLGAGTSYPFLPLSTGTGRTGWVNLAFTTLQIDAVIGDVLSIYIDGQSGDTARSGAVEIFADHTLTEIASGVLNTLTSTLTTVSSIGKLIVDYLNASISSRAAPGDAMAVSSMQQAALADFFDTNSGKVAQDAVAGSVVKEIINGSGSSGVLGASVPGSYASGTAGYALGRIGNGEITTVSPVGASGDIEIVIGADYYSADSQQLSWTLDSTAPNLTGASGSIYIHAPTVVSGSVAFSNVGTSAQVVTSELGKAKTSQLQAVSYNFSVWANLSNGHEVAIVKGKCTALNYPKT